VGKYDTARQATDDNIIWHTGIEYWITKATNMFRIWIFSGSFNAHPWVIWNKEAP
jgi:hypothetical protein